MIREREWQWVCAALAVVALVAAVLLLRRDAVPDPNIITLLNNPTRCGGATICSYDGTVGYINDGSGQPFNLSTIRSWFQIDPDGVNQLTTQNEAEPDKGAGSFLVVNDTGKYVETVQLKIRNTFTAETPSVTYCSDHSGPLCDNFQAGKGAANPPGSYEALSGGDYYSCTNGRSEHGYACASEAGQAGANVEPGAIYYTWSGLHVAPGQTFNITFASWNNASRIIGVFLS